MHRWLVVGWRPLLLVLGLALGLSFAAGWLAGQQTEPAGAPAPAELDRLKASLQQIFADRARALITGEHQLILPHYDTRGYSGEAAQAHELVRADFVHEWLKTRQVRVIHLESDLRVIDAGVRNGTAWASVCQHLRLRYHHEDDSGAGASLMGARTMHWLELTKQDGRWRITRDWFWDPFKDATTFTSVAALDRRAPYLAGVPQVTSSGAPGKFNRQQALAYADRYCGVRASSDDGRYNSKYLDFTSLGGDCANFASQVLSDSEAGGMSMDGGWWAQGVQATSAWTCADSFVEYLIYSGRGVLLARGDLAAVTARTAEHPQGAVFRLEPGDIIGYEKRGSLRHVSVVAGRDQSGYPVVDSHTGDRYHVPWDLGYDSRTKYWLVHVVW